MYGALWRILPGPAWVRVLTLIVLAAGVIAVLFTWVFPWIDEIVNPVNATVGISEPSP